MKRPEEWGFPEPHLYLLLNGEPVAKRHKLYKKLLTHGTIFSNESPGTEVLEALFREKGLLGKGASLELVWSQPYVHLHDWVQGAEVLVPGPAIVFSVMEYRTR
jgi:hypothetical protein